MIMKRILMVVMVALNCVVYAQTTIQHIVQRGETLESIANKFGVSVDALKQMNKEVTSYLYAGMTLVIPQQTNVTTNAESAKGIYRPQNFNELDVNDTRPVLQHYVEAGYDRVHFSATKGGFSRDFNFLNLGYHMIAGIFPKIPEMKIETGLNFLYGTSNNEQYNVMKQLYHVDYTYSYIELPILVNYQLLNYEAIQLSPKLGVYGKYNISATIEDYSNNKDVEYGFDYFGMQFKKHDQFKQKKSEWNWKRFCWGANVGIDAIIYEHFVAGVTYSYEFNKVDPYMGYHISSDIGVKLGYIF